MARTYADTSGTGPLAFVDDVSVQGHNADQIPLHSANGTEKLYSY